jgi:hypothetical protein
MVPPNGSVPTCRCFLNIQGWIKEAMHTLLTVHNTSNKRRKGTVETARTCLLTRLPKCGQARAHGAQAVGQATPVRQQADILGICTRAIALASSMQDWRAAHGLTLPLGLYLVWSVIWDFKRGWFGLSNEGFLEGCLWSQGAFQTPASQGYHH